LHRLFEGGVRAAIWWKKKGVFVFAEGCVLAVAGIVLSFTARGQRWDGVVMLSACPLCCLGPHRIHTYPPSIVGRQGLPKSRAPLLRRNPLRIALCAHIGRLRPSGRSIHRWRHRPVVPAWRGYLRSYNRDLGHLPALVRAAHDEPAQPPPGLMRVSLSSSSVYLSRRKIAFPRKGSTKMHRGVRVLPTHHDLGEEAVMEA
jgi:hypothetical protein